MRRALPLLLVLVLTATGLLGQDTKSQPHILSYTPPDPSSPVPGETLRKVSVQIELLCKVNGQPQPIAGTGVVVAIQAPPAEKDLSFQYLVTNRHVAECWDEANHPQEVLSADVRINTQDGAAIRLPLNGVHDEGKPTWYFPNDDSVDLAVTPVRPPDNPKLDYLMIGLDTPPLLRKGGKQQSSTRRASQS